MADDRNGTTAEQHRQAVIGGLRARSLLVREEIELAKAEISEKVSKLVKGAVVGDRGRDLRGRRACSSCCTAARGWLYMGARSTTRSIWGFLVVAAILFLLAGLAGFLAAAAFKKGAPPTPEMAIDEAKRIKDTVQHGSSAGVGG